MLQCKRHFLLIMFMPQKAYGMLLQLTHEEHERRRSEHDHKASADVTQ